MAFGSGSVDAGCSNVLPSNDNTKAAGIHCIKNLNDGKFGNKFSWIPNKVGVEGQFFAGIQFAAPIQLNAIAFSRDGTGGVLYARTPTGGSFGLG